jgi:hypothetical protein
MVGEWTTGQSSNVARGWFGKTRALGRAVSQCDLYGDAQNCKFSLTVVLFTVKKTCLGICSGGRSRTGIEIRLGDGELFCLPTIQTLKRSIVRDSWAECAGWRGAQRHGALAGKLLD